jgi:hypothetical protein
MSLRNPIGKAMINAKVPNAAQILIAVRRFFPLYPP